MLLKNIAFIGDSLTEYFHWQGRFPQYRVMNLGVSGETVEGLVERLERIRLFLLEPDNKPDIIFLMTGINNIAMEDYDIIKPYSKLLGNITTWFKEIKIVVQSVLPVNLSWIDNKAIKAINKLLKERAEQFNAGYLDIYSFFVDAQGLIISEYLLDDGVHLSDKGYEVWAKAVEGYIQYN